MKRTLMVLSVIAVMFFFTACGSQEKASEAKPTETTQKAEATDKTTEAKQETEAADKITEAQPASEEAGSTTEAASEEDDDDYVPELDPPDEKYDAPEAGITIPVSETYNQNRDKTYLAFDGGIVREGIYYMEFSLYPVNKIDLWTMSDSEYDDMRENILNVLTVFKVLDSSWTAYDMDKWVSWISGIEEGSIKEFKKDGDYTLYYTMETEYTENLPDEIKPVYDGIIAELKAAKDKTVIYEPKSQSEILDGKVIEFETTDLEGNTVSSKDIFAKNKFTMINFWASWCGPCVSELPELEVLNKSFEEKGCGIIGILTDGLDPAGLADALDIIADTRVTYLNLIDSMGLASDLEIQAVPTTIFVDSNGVIVGDTVVGALFSMYESVMKDLLGE